MGNPIIAWGDIEEYIPQNISPERKENIIQLSIAVMRAVHRQLPIGFSYNGGIHRIVLPHSLYLQKTTPDRQVELPRENHATRMKLSTKGARRAIAFDGYQVASTDPKAREWWKSFHIDRVESLELYTKEEMENILRWTEKEGNLWHFDPVNDFVGNWNFWFRTYLTQVPAKKDIREVIPGIKLLDTP